MQVHASCVARAGAGLLLLGASGAGKSDLALRLIGRGFVLVADDRVVVTDGSASPPDRLAGLLEVRGLGLLRFPHVAPVKLVLALDLDSRPERLPATAAFLPGLGLRVLAFNPWEVSAPDKADAALALATGSTASVAGAFA